MELTKHAQKRVQQRGVSKETIDRIMYHGKCEIAPGGALKIFLGNKEHQELTSRLKRDIQLLDKAKGGTIIIVDGKIVTIYKEKKR